MITRFFTLVALTLSLTYVSGQNLEFPDAKLKTALLSQPNNVDLNQDGEIQIEEASQIKTLDLSNRGISNLQGIEAFTSLTHLNCRINQLDSISIPANTSLTWLDCSYNQISSIDISFNTALTYLACQDNQFTFLDITKNTELSELYCSSTLISTIDLSNNNSLTRINCSNSANLKNLNIINLTQLTYLNCSSSPKLNYVCINEAQAENIQRDPINWLKGSNTSWNINCTSSIEENANAHTQNSHQIVRIYNMAGQEVISETLTEGLYVYLYSDGSTKKIYRNTQSTQNN